MRRLALLAVCASLSVLLATSGVSAQTAAPGPPTNLSATAVGGSLTVTWSAPSEDGGGPIASYDLQYGEGDATNLPTSWTVLDEVWTSGSLSAVVSGLMESTAYAVQVRAVNSFGDGDWSVAVAQTTADHGNTRATATPLALGDDVPGTIDPGPPAEVNFFSFTIDEDQTDLWLYTTGDTDTHGSLYNSSGMQLAANNDGFHPNGLTNFEIRAVLNPGTYHVQCQGLRHSRAPGPTRCTRARRRRPLATSREHRDGDHAHLGRGRCSPGSSTTGLLATMTRPIITSSSCSPAPPMYSSRPPETA